MAFTPPGYYDIQNAVIASLQNNLVIVDPTTGNRILPNFSNGSVLLSFSQVLALVMDAFYGQMVAVDAALRLASAVGPDLDAIGAFLGAPRHTGQQSTIPGAFTSKVASLSDVPIPVGFRVLGQDQFGNDTLEYLTIQDPTQPLGTAGVKIAGSLKGWALCKAVDNGAAGNIAAGQLTTLGATLAGIDGVSNPAVSTPSAPTVSVIGSPGLTQRQYGVVAHGLTGTTPVSPIGVMSTGNATPNDLITLPITQDASSYDVLLNVGNTTPPNWQLIANVPASTPTLAYTGQTTTIYAIPTSNTTNAGVGGADDEPDDGNPGYRQRIPTVLQSAASSTAPAIITAVSAIPGVTRVFGVDGTPGTFDLYYAGSSYPLPDFTIAAITAAYLKTKAAGIFVSPLQVLPARVDITYTFKSTPGIVASTLITSINASIAGYFYGLSLGDAVSAARVQAAILNTPGVASVSPQITLTVEGGATYTGLDVPGSPTTLYTTGLFTATGS